MENVKYYKAYTEVIKILKCLPKEDIAKIPKDIIEVLEKNHDKKYTFELEKSKSLKEQKIMIETKAILANLFRDYWATPEQKEVMLSKEQLDIRKKEENKIKEYSNNEIFASKTNKKIDNNNSNQRSLPIAVKKKNIFQKILTSIISLFKK